MKRIVYGKVVHVYDMVFLGQINIMKNQEDEEMVMKQVEEMTEAVRSMFGDAKKCSEKLSLIDLIQRLGLYYYFEDEINEVLGLMHNASNLDEEDVDLYTMALRFRLLRQKGFFVSCGKSLSTVLLYEITFCWKKN